MMDILPYRAFAGLFLFLCLMVGGCGTSSGPAGKRGKTVNPGRLRQPFAEAVLSSDKPPSGADKPLDQTFTGKPTHQILESVRDNWEKFDFLDGQGHPTQPVVVLETGLGEVEITLKPQAAPNHCRNFLALTQAGYFNGMRFDKIRQEEVAGAPELSVSSLEAGCPAGFGNTGGGNLGYWLRSEAGEKGLQQLQMKKGVVGACLGESPDSACCRFFILLADAPSLEAEHTAFAHVSKGFEVVQAIAKRSLDGGPDGEEPVVIRRARYQGN